jgi:hypothetical protein
VMVACGVMRAVLGRRLTRLGQIAAGRTAASAPATPAAALTPISPSNRSAPR